MPIKKFFQAIIRLFSAKKRKRAPHKKTTGTIKFFDRKKRFGFVIAGKHEYFFHASSAKPQDFKWLRDGAQIRFIVTQSPKGPQADHIEIVKS